MKRKRTIDELEQELEALTPEQARAVLADTKQPETESKPVSKSKYADPEIIDIKKYPLQEWELKGWTACSTDAERVACAIDVRRAMHWLETNNWLE